MLLRKLRIPSNRGSHIFSCFLKCIRQYRIALLLLVLAAILEVTLHARKYAVPQPGIDLDKPFYTTCQEPAVNQTRESAALVMLVRNWELDKALRTVHSIEDHFNKWFHYPIVFLNDEPWTDEFMERMKEAASGEVIFDVLTQEEWSFPAGMDVEAAKEDIDRQGRAGVLYGGLESYHHMCRFFSGKFYNTPALSPYKWYWRIEPDVEFHCAITYDPFVEMARHDKIYGFTIALPELPRTCPGLFRRISNFKEARYLPTTTLWKAMVSPSWVPWPLRGTSSWLFGTGHTDRHGDSWNLCHYWSNFEIASLDFFRGKEYQDLARSLDITGGFYHERWGDADVHSLALAMLLDARYIHHFKDIGYHHDIFTQCPVNAPGEKQLPCSESLMENQPWAPEGRHDDPDAIGCRCECNAAERGTMDYPGYCTHRLTLPNRARRS